MPRRSPFRDDLRSLKVAVDSLSQTPLGPIAENLRSTFEPLLIGNASNAVIEPAFDLAGTIKNLLSQLPASYGARFDFDAAFVFALAVDWNPNLALPGMSVPKHLGQWGFSELLLPTIDKQRMPIVRVFHFPGQDSIEEIDLLAYPWLAHEVAHCLLFLNSVLFPTEFKPRLDGVLHALSLKGIADRGLARTLARAGLDEMKQYWTPTLDQGNWAHEIAMDIIALWSCGPAYLGAFLDEVERDNLDMFQISAVHPPYCVRILAILCACPLLKLDAHAAALRALSASLSKQYPNKLAQLAPEELIAAAVDAGFAVCKTLEIRDWKYFSQGGPGSSSPDTYELGVALLLEAWRVRNQVDEKSYLKWEKEVITTISAGFALKQ